MIFMIFVILLWNFQIFMILLIYNWNLKFIMIFVILKCNYIFSWCLFILNCKNKDLLCFYNSLMECTFFIIVLILNWNFMIFIIVFDCHMEFTDFHNFLWFCHVFLDFHDFVVLSCGIQRFWWMSWISFEIIRFYDLSNSLIGSYFLMIFMILTWNYMILMIWIILT